MAESKDPVERADGLTGSLLIEQTKSGPYWRGKWRNTLGEQKMVSLGPAWVRPHPRSGNVFIDKDAQDARDRSSVPAWEKKWRKKPGKPKDGALDEKGAVVRLRERQIEAEKNILDDAYSIIERQQEARSMKEACARWMDDGERVRGLSPTTLRDHKSTVKKHIVGNMRLNVDDVRKLTAGDVKKWRDHLDGQRKPNGTRVYSKRTVNKIRMTLYGVMEHACVPVELGGLGLPENVVKHVKPLKEDERVQQDPLTPSEVMQVVAALEAGRHRQSARVAHGKRKKGRQTKERPRTAAEVEQDQQDAALVMVLAFSGLRLGEAAALRWSRVDFAGSRIRVERSYSATTKVEKGTKGKEARWTVLPAQTAQALARLSQRGHHDKADDLVFAGARGGFLDGSAALRRFKSAMAAAGVTGPGRMHDLRHAAVTDLREIFGVDVAMKMAGHKDARTALRYAHARDQTSAAKMWTDYLQAKIAPQAVEEVTD